MIPFIQSLFMSWSCRQYQITCYLVGAAERGNSALWLVSEGRLSPMSGEVEVAEYDGLAHGES